MMSIWQQALALDARYTGHRPVPERPAFRTLYLRRRSQLLRDYSGKSERCSAWRREYLKVRGQLLAARYGVLTAPSEPGSLRSRATSLRSLRLDSDMGDGSFLGISGGGGVHEVRKRGITSVDSKSEVVPTARAEASRALAGDTSTAENYAFHGVYHIFDQHSGAISRLRFAHNDKSRLATASHDGTLSVCQLVPSPATVVCHMRGHHSAITDMQWSSDNDLILSVSMDGSARLWSVSNAQCLREFKALCASSLEDDEPQQLQLQQQHSSRELNESPALYACDFLPSNNNLFVVACGRGFVQVTNLSTGKPVRGGRGRCIGQLVLSLALDALGTVLWAGDERGCIQAFSMQPSTGVLGRQIRRLTVHEGAPITSLSARAWLSREAADPCLLANVGGISALMLFRIVRIDGQLALRRKYSIKHSAAHGVGDGLITQVRSSFCPLMSFRQGACVVSGSEDACVYMFDVTRDYKPCVNKLQGHAVSVTDVTFNYDESLLASGDTSGLIILWRRA